MQVERVLVERAVVALMAALTPAKHLALRVTTEHRGGCGWQKCAPSCVEHRQLIAELWEVLNATTEAAERGEDGARPSESSTSDPATAAGGRARPAAGCAGSDGPLEHS